MPSLSKYFDKNPLPLLHAAGWLIYILGDYADHALFEAYNPLPTVLSGFAAYLLSGGIALLDKYLDKNALPVWRWGVFAALLGLSMVLWHKIFLICHTESEDRMQVLEGIFADDFAAWMGLGYMPILLFLFWAAMYFLVRSYMAGRDKEKALQAAQLETKRAELRMLRHQLNPHFLFNALNSVDVSARAGDNETAHKMTQHLSRFLRTSLEQGDGEKITLAQELEMLRDYVAIEEVRFQDRLTVRMDATREAEDCLVPPMLLQPLVENALRFAWAAAAGGAVMLNARIEEDVLYILLRNAFDPATKSAGTGTGLKNTRNRLELTYGNKASFETKVQGSDFCVIIRLPVETFAS